MRDLWAFDNRCRNWGLCLVVSSILVFVFGRVGYVLFTLCAACQEAGSHSSADFFVYYLTL